MTKKQKKMLARIIISFVLLVGLMVFEHLPAYSVLEGKWYEFVPYLIPYLIVGYDIILKAAKNIAHGKVFDENFLMMIATFGAFIVKEFPEAAGVMIFYQIGELFQNYAVGKSRASIAAMMDIAPEYANVEENGELVEKDPDEVMVDDIIVVKPGEKIPLDGVVIEGASLVDTASLTGESVPRTVRVGDDVISGCVNGSGTLKVRVTKAYEDSTVSRILELVENASSRKAPVENFITHFARYYTPVVTIGAVLLAIIPPLLGLLGPKAGLTLPADFNGSWGEWIHRACTFLVISCPCALVISIPMGFFGGIGAASRIGVLVKGSNYLEALSQVKTIVFDKTGTLTKGEFTVTKLAAEPGVGEGRLLETAALAENYSDHPIAVALRASYGKKIDSDRVTEASEIAGHGISVKVDGRQCLAGNMKLMKKFGIDCAPSTEIGTIVYVAEDGRYLGSIVISDVIKEGASVAISDMKKAGVRKAVMLTGDKRETGEAVAHELGIDEVHAELLPADKVAEVEKLLGAQSGSDKTAFVGDGINDAPVLTRADVGIAMGSLGSDAAIEAADIVLMDDDITKIAKTVRISRKTLRIVRQNIIFALGVKLVVLILGALGLASMWLAMFADVGVAVLAILNAMRALSIDRSEK